MEDEFNSDHERDVREIEAGMSILFDMAVVMHTTPLAPLADALVEWSAIWLRFMVDHDVLSEDEATNIVEHVAGPCPEGLRVEPTERQEQIERLDTPMSADEVLDMLNDIESL